MNIHIWIKNTSQHWDKHIWPTFGVNSNSLSILYNNRSSLSLRWEFNNSTAITIVSFILFFLEFILSIKDLLSSTFQINEESQNSLFSHISLSNKSSKLFGFFFFLLFKVIYLDGSIAIENDTVLNNWPNWPTILWHLINGSFHLCWEFSSICCSFALESCSISMKGHTGHFIFSKSTSFIRADVSNSSHCFCRSKVSN